MQIKHVSYAYDKQKVLHDINTTLKAGSITTLMGANGCGKTTLFKLCLRTLKLQRGKIFLDGKAITDYHNKAYAAAVAIVYQQNQIINDITVERYIAYGRTPYLKPLQRLSKEDYQQIDWAIEVTNLGDIRRKPVVQLSGGQRQRVYIAMALAQRSRWLFLDEPTTYLDIKYQLEILELIKTLNRQYGISIVMVLHDMMQAINYSDQVIGMADGKICFQGAPQDVLSAARLSELFDTELTLTQCRGAQIVLPVALTTK